LRRIEKTKFKLFERINDLSQQHKTYRHMLKRK